MNTSFIVLSNVNPLQCITAISTVNNQFCDGLRVYALEVRAENISETVNYIQIQPHYLVVIVNDLESEDCNDYYTQCSSIIFTSLGILTGVIIIFVAIMVIMIMVCTSRIRSKHKTRHSDKISLKG